MHHDVRERVRGDGLSASGSSVAPPLTTTIGLDRSYSAGHSSAISGRANASPTICRIWTRSRSTTARSTRVQPGDLGLQDDHVAAREDVKAAHCAGAVHQRRCRHRSTATGLRRCHELGRGSRTRSSPERSATHRADEDVVLSPQDTLGHAGRCHRCRGCTGRQGTTRRPAVPGTPRQQFLVVAAPGRRSWPNRRPPGSHSSCGKSGRTPYSVGANAS